MKHIALAWALLGLPSAGLTHEFWIEPKLYQVETDAEIVASLFVGQSFGGSEQAYIGRNFARFDMTCGSGPVPVEGRDGDRPAMTVAADTEGLCVVVHQTRDYTLTYHDWEQFVDFVKHKDFKTALADHAARGLPETEFIEKYSRYAKSLIAVGAGAGSDVVAGLLTEIVAEANPYTDDLGSGLPVRVLYEGKPRIDAQVELFEKAPDGTVEITMHRTDSEGRVSLPVKPGHTYLADAVVLREVEPVAKNDPVWESLWAALTFGVPEAR